MEIRGFNKIAKSLQHKDLTAWRKRDILPEMGKIEAGCEGRIMAPKDLQRERAGPYEVVLYTRVGCHLCDEAELVLIEHGLRPSKIDIDDDSNLQERFDTCVPVVEIDGRIRFRGRVNRVLLRRLLRS
jgi:glutaredoxin